MKIVDGPSRMVKVPLLGSAADIVDGALIVPGATAGTDLGLFIKTSGTGVDAIGVLEGLHNYSVVGDSAILGTGWVEGYVNMVLPGCLLAAEYDQTDTLTADGGSSSTTLTITSLEDNIDGSWIYVVSGDSAGLLAFTTASASGSCTLKTAPTTAIGTTDEVIKILRLGHSLLDLNAATDKLGTQAAVGGWTAMVVRNQIRYDGSQDWEDLDPTIHDNMTGLNNKNVKFRSIVAPRNTAMASID